MDTVVPITTVIDICRVVSKKLFNGEPIPTRVVQVVGCLVAPTRVEYLVKIGVKYVTVDQSTKTIGPATWDADIVEEDSVQNIQSRFLGRGSASYED